MLPYYITRKQEKMLQTRYLYHRELAHYPVQLLRLWLNYDRMKK